MPSVTEGRFNALTGTEGVAPALSAKRERFLRIECAWTTGAVESDAPQRKASFRSLSAGETPAVPVNA